MNPIGGMNLIMDAVSLHPDAAKRLRELVRASNEARVKVTEFIDVAAAVLGVDPNVHDFDLAAMAFIPKPPHAPNGEALLHSPEVPL